MALLVWHNMSLTSEKDTYMGKKGLIPVVGDLIGVLLALHLVKVACRADLPNHIIAKMLANVFIDFMQVCFFS